MKKDAKKETQRKRGSGEFHPERQSAGQGGVQEVSERDRDQCLSTGGQTGIGRNIPQIACLLGGIIEQLLESEEERLNEVKECIDWYNREEEKVSRRIKKLKQLQNLATAELENISTDTEEE
jgi:hypothetical protein